MNALIELGWSKKDSAFAQDILRAATACVAEGSGSRFTPVLADMLTPRIMFEHYVIGELLGRPSGEGLAMVAELLDQPALGLQSDLAALAATVRREFPEGGRVSLAIRDQVKLHALEWMLNAKRRPEFSDGLDRLGRMAMRVAVAVGAAACHRGTTKALWEVYDAKPLLADLAFEALAVIEIYDRGDSDPLLTALDTTARTLRPALQGQLSPVDEKLIAACLDVTGAAGRRPITLREIKSLRNALTASGYEAPLFRVGTLVSALKRLADDVDGHQSEQWIQESIEEIRFSADEGITSLTEYGSAYLAAAEVICQQAEEPTLPDGAVQGWCEVVDEIARCCLGEDAHQQEALGRIQAWVDRQSRPAVVERP